MDANKINIHAKIVGGEGCYLSLLPDANIMEVKLAIETQLKVPADQQKLLYKGKPLTDPKTLSEYNIGSGATLYVMKTKSGPASSSSPSPVQQPPPDILHSEMKKFLKRYFTESEAEKIAAEYMKDFNNRLGNCSLDDFERVATRYLQNGA